MGSGTGAAQETVETMTAAGEKVGMVQVRLFQPFPSEELVAALPSTVKSIAVLDRCKEPGAVGEPFYLETVAAINEAMDSQQPAFAVRPRVIGGRYGLSSKEFTPSMVKPIFDELAKEAPKRHFTVGIYDDVTNLSLPIDRDFVHPRPEGEVHAMFFGLGSDGTVGANKASVKIIGEGTDLFSQGHFVYDSKKSGAVTVSHLRFGPREIRSTYEIVAADFVACHQFGLLAKMPVLDRARKGATFLLNSPYGPDEVWGQLPSKVQQQIVDKEIDLYVIDAFAVAAEAGMGNRINTVMQPCFFKLSGVLPEAEAIAAIKGFVEKTYGKRGEKVVQRNFAAIDMSLERLHKVEVGPAPAAVEHPGTGARPRARLRQAGDRAHHGRRGRPAAGQRHARGRDLPDCHHQVGEARHRAEHPHLGSSHLHRLRQVRHRLSARGHPHEGLSGLPAERRSGGLPLQGVQVARPAGPSHHHPGRPGRLHRLWRLRRCLSCQGQDRGQAQGHQPGALPRASRPRAQALGPLPLHPAARP